MLKKELMLAREEIQDLQKELQNLKTSFKEVENYVEQTFEDIGDILEKEEKVKQLRKQTKRSIWW